MPVARGSVAGWSSSVFAFAACTVLGAACGASKEEVKREFADVVAESNSCERDGDCTVISIGCPLGCEAAINAEHKDRVERRARELITDYERGGQACAYDCALQGPAACSANRCDFAGSDATDAAVDADR